MMNQQRRYFATGATLPVAFRIEQLKKLKSLLAKYEVDITEALNKDLHKSAMESVMTELILVVEEINFIIKHLKKWSRPTKVTTPFPLLWPGRSRIYYEPYGSVLIIAPWNYPIMLSLSPLVGAISAGNCAVIKPSEIATHSQNIIAQLINDHFPPEYISVVKGGPDEVTQLLQEKFDYIFFTGGAQIGKIIMQAAAKHLTPITLELGGKSPCIVDETANLDFAARRIIRGKMMNAGQTCIAPDYLYVHHSRKEALINKLRDTIIKFYGNDPENSESFGRIIDQKHFDRLTGLLKTANILYGGKTNASTRYISPTLIETASWNEPVMQQEIFGPLLPILTYDKFDDIIHPIKSQPKPLALYLFSKNKNHETSLLRQLSFGGGCMNDCLLHIANYYFPFGGIGASGMGGYHGKYSFELFSHQKSIYKKTWPLEMKLEYPPFSLKKLKWLRRLLRTHFF